LRDRISKYKIVWLQVCFDLPTQTKRQRKEYSEFRKRLLKDGFIQMQYSVYLRYCGSHETANVHERRLSAWVPPEGHVWLMRFTDTQYSNGKHYWGINMDPKSNLSPGAQLELF
jgi:CRISPR-associated protein Cas2